MQLQKQKFILPIFLLMAIAATGWFFSHYQLKFQNPVSIKIATPIYWIPRVMAMNITIVKQADESNPLTEDQKFACKLFGKDCVTALAIMRAESHNRHDAININKNGSADLGCFQLNTVHLAQIDTKNLNLLNCQDNAKAAYAIYKQQKGFTAWVTFASGDYKKYLIN